MKERLVYIMENIYLDGSVGDLNEDIAIGQKLVDLMIAEGVDNFYRAFDILFGTTMGFVKDVSDLPRRRSILDHMRRISGTAMLDDVDYNLDYIKNRKV